jgi:thiol:disulfide interchange protein DsbG
MMNKLKMAFGAMALSFCWVGTSYAAMQSGAPKIGTVTPSFMPEIKAAVGNATHNLALVDHIAPGPNGLIKVFVTGKAGSPAAGKKALFWYLPNGGYLLIGSLFAENGANMTEQDAQKAGFIEKNTQTSALLSAYKPGAKQFAVMRAMQSAKGFHGFNEGHGPVHITAIIDPNCIFCHLWWGDLQKTKNWQSKYTVTWVPVGFLKPSSNGKAAALLAGKVKALNTNETKFIVPTEEGGVQPLKSEKLSKEVIENTNLWETDMTALNMEAGTPTLVTQYGVFAGAIPPATLVARK